MLQWDKTDFIECLEVVPEEIEIDYHGPCSVFRVERKGIQLELTVFPFEEDVRFRLLRSGEKEPFFEYQILSCRSSSYEKLEDGRERLRFINQANMYTHLRVTPDIRLFIHEKI